MESRRALLVDAFTSEPLSGNAAGVVPGADGLNAEAMENIARELHASETVFLLESDDDADRRLRFFTPTGEIDLCGHATIASHAHLFAEGTIDAGTHTVETNDGPMEVEVDDDGRVWMYGSPATVEFVDLAYDRVAAAIGTEPATMRDVGADLPLARASIGLEFLVVPVNFLAALSGLDPDFEAIASLTEKLDVTGIYAFTFDTLSTSATLHGRMFAPRVGVPEDPATGTASGAVGAYLREVAAFDGDMRAEMQFEQGHFVDRPGEVTVRARSDPIAVGGRATTALDGTILVPEFEDDGIIEL